MTNYISNGRDTEFKVAGHRPLYNGQSMEVARFFNRSSSVSLFFHKQSKGHLIEKAFGYMLVSVVRGLTLQIN